MNKVKYGLSNVHAFPITETSAQGEPTYGTAIPIPGAVTLTMDPEETNEPFHADNVVFFMTRSNNGYSGSLEIALTPEAFRTDILGDIVDDQGVVLEGALAMPKEFALTFQFEGDVSATRHVLYRISGARPGLSGSTITDTATPQTETLELVAMPRIDTRVVKAYADAESAAYDSWNTAPYDFTALA